MPRAQAFKEAAFNVFRGLGRDYRGAFDQPGPPIEVQPFRTGEASPGAGIARILTSMASYSRARANFREAQRQQRLKEGFLQAQTAQMLARASGAMTPYEQARLNLSRDQLAETTRYHDTLTGQGERRTTAYVNRTNREPAGSNTVPQQVGAATKALGIVNTKLQEFESDAAIRGREDALKWLRYHDSPPNGRYAEAAANMLGIRKGQILTPADRAQIIRNHVDRWVGLAKTGTAYKQLLAQRAPYEAVIQSTGLTGEPGDVPAPEDDWQPNIPDPTEVGP